MGACDSRINAQMRADAARIGPNERRRITHRSCWSRVTRVSLLPGILYLVLRLWHVLVIHLDLFRLRYGVTLLHDHKNIVQKKGLYIFPEKPYIWHVHRHIACHASSRKYSGKVMYSRNFFAFFRTRKNDVNGFVDDNWTSPPPLPRNRGIRWWTYQSICAYLFLDQIYISSIYIFLFFHLFIYYFAYFAHLRYISIINFNTCTLSTFIVTSK